MNPLIEELPSCTLMSVLPPPEGRICTSAPASTRVQPLSQQYFSYLVTREDGLFQTLQPIGVEFEETEDGIVAYSERFNCAGAGPDRLEAFRDFSSELLLLKRSLESTSNLAPEAQEILRNLRSLGIFPSSAAEPSH